MEQINIHKILLEKSPKLAKIIPRFLINGVGKIIRVKKLNHILENYSHLKPYAFLTQCLNYMGVKFELHNIQNIPADKKILFVSNHPLGGLDGMTLALALHETTQNEVMFVVNDILMNLKPLAPIFVPVNKHGRQSNEYMKQHTAAYEGGNHVITFPAGLCSRLINGKIQDTQWKTNFIAKAKQYKRTIVPIYTDGTNSKSFYRTALWREKLGIKANIEMILLPKEMFNKQNQTINIYIGKPIEIDDTYTPKEWCEIIRTAAYDMKPDNTKPTK